MYRFILKPILFLFSAEKAHHMTMSLVIFISRIPFVRSLFKSIFTPSRQSGITLGNLHFPNRVGLAAGFDKDGKYLQALQYLPFGHIEVGTVTPRPQPGNPKPRLFRLPADKALINRMGFNNEGSKALRSRLQRLKKIRPLIIGGNIGKNKDTPLENAPDDYLHCFHSLFDFVDYFTVNVSSPNTPGLRSLQDKEPLEKLLGLLQEANRLKPAGKPILLKIAPDLTNAQLDEIIEICKNKQIDGIIATNTTIDRSGLHTAKGTIEAIGNGGLSGKPVLERSTEVLAYIREKMPRPFIIIGVGGITSAEDAQLKLDSGADLVQIYSGMIYSGPGLVRATAAL